MPDMVYLCYHTNFGLCDNSLNSINSAKVIWGKQYYSFPVVTCSDLRTWADFPNGQITYNKQLVGGRIPWKTVATYTCNSGYSRDGGSASTCRNTGVWQGLSPTCKKSNRITQR